MSHLNEKMMLLIIALLLVGGAILHNQREEQEVETVNYSRPFAVGFFDDRSAYEAGTARNEGFVKVWFLSGDPAAEQTMIMAVAQDLTERGVMVEPRDVVSMITRSDIFLGEVEGISVQFDPDSSGTARILYNLSYREETGIFEGRWLDRIVEFR